MAHATTHEFGPISSSRGVAPVASGSEVASIVSSNEVDQFAVLSAEQIQIPTPYPSSQALPRLSIPTRPHSRAHKEPEGVAGVVTGFFEENNEDHKCVHNAVHAFIGDLRYLYIHSIGLPQAAKLPDYLYDPAPVVPYPPSTPERRPMCVIKFRLFHFNSNDLFILAGL